MEGLYAAFLIVSVVLGAIDLFRNGSLTGGAVAAFAGAFLVKAIN